MNALTRFRIARTVCRFLPPLIAQRVRSAIYSESLARKFPLEVFGRAITGSNWSGRTDDRNAYPFSVHGYFDWRRLAIALAVCEKGDSIIEIGGNIGTETIGFSDIVGSHGRVLSFEPFPANFEILKQAVARLQYSTNVILYPLAVGDVYTKLYFKPPHALNSGTGFIQHQSSDINNIEVSCVTLDSMRNNIPVTKILFSDAEGNEYRIIQGARDLINRDHPFLVLEACPETLERSGDSMDLLFTDLRSLGYLVFAIERFGLREIKFSWSFKPEGNMFCCPDHQKRMIDRVQSSILRCGLCPPLPGANPMVLKRTVTNSLLSKTPGSE